MAIPPTDAPLERAIGFGALKLLALRASDADRKFAVTDENVSVAIDICRQLDGVPLAIEMAVARVRQLGLTGVRDHLKDRLHVLRSERDAPSRQQTLQATLDWSYALLLPNERKLLRRVAVLVNGFTLDMAQAVASDPELDDLAILDALGGLVEKSLVQVVGGDRDEQPRYFLLETTRLYALDQLSAAGETEAFLERRGQVLATWAAETSAAYLETPEQVWLRRCLPEWENVMTGLDWAQSRGAADQFIPLFIAAARMAPHGGDVVVVRRYVDTTCSIARDVTPESATQLLRSVGDCLALVSNRRALETYRAAVEKARASGDRWLLYWSLVAYARLLASGSNLEAPKVTDAVIDEARGLEDPSWPKVVRAILRHAEGGACAEGGDIMNARARYLEALKLHTEARSASGARAARLALLDIEARAGNDAE
ncbi:MAG: hypothetical protein ABWY12_10465, partial [Burkholderiales bacterium]